VKSTFLVKKVLNNNVLIATHDEYKETVMIGKGIGFGKKGGEEITETSAEKLFVLHNEREQEQYKMLLTQVDEKIVVIMNDIISYIQHHVKTPLNEHIHISLTDHISFAIKRVKQGMDINNPFLLETKVLYPTEYELARHVLEMIKEQTGISLPEGEIGFVALHIHTAITARDLSEINRHSELIQTIISMIENGFSITLDKESLNYMRLIRHLHFAIERANKGEEVEEPKKLAELLKKEYPLCYNLSWKVVKVMQQALSRPVDEAEAVYLTMHLQRLMTKI
jgi:transcriptional antiterminator